MIGDGHSLSCRQRELSPSLVVFFDLMGTSELFLGSTTSELKEASSSYNHWAKQVIDYAGRGTPSSFPVFSFSDCIYLSYPWCRNEKCTIGRLKWLFFLSGYAQFSAIQYGFVLRGGAARGSLASSKTGIGGPAVVEAYIQESKIAKFPRTSLSSEAQTGARKLPELYNYANGVCWPSFGEYLRIHNRTNEAIGLLNQIAVKRPHKYIDWLIGSIE